MRRGVRGVVRFLVLVCQATMPVATTETAATKGMAVERGNIRGSSAMEIAEIPKPTISAPIPAIKKIAVSSK
jgi:hypothetical protein